MKKLFIILLALVFVVACEIHTSPYSGVKTYYPKATITWEPVSLCPYDPVPYPIEWADYCVDECCMWEVWDGAWMCQELWCYNDIACEWDVTEVCY